MQGVELAYVELARASYLKKKESEEMADDQQQDPIPTAPPREAISAAPPPNYEALVEHDELPVNSPGVRIAGTLTSSMAFAGECIITR